MPPAPWTDATVMPWGKHKGTKIGELPASYLLWLYEQTWIRDWPGLHLYLKAHENQLMAEKRDSEEKNEGGDDLTSFEDYKNYRN